MRSTAAAAPTLPTDPRQTSVGSASKVNSPYLMLDEPLLTASTRGVSSMRDHSGLPLLRMTFSAPALAACSKVSSGLMAKFRTPRLEQLARRVGRITSARALSDSSADCVLKGNGGAG